MGKSILTTVLLNYGDFKLDDEIYIADGAEISPSVEIEIMPSDHLRPAEFNGQRYFLGIEQIRNAIEAAEGALGRQATLNERFIAVKHFADYDAFISPEELLSRTDNRPDHDPTD